MLKTILGNKYDLNKIKFVYLIPSKDVGDKKIKEINKKFVCTDDTIIVRFNKTDHDNHKLFDNKTDIRFIRGHGRGRHLKIGYQLLGATNTDAIYIANNEDERELTIIKNVNNLSNLYSFGQIGIIWDYVTILEKLHLNVDLKPNVKGPSIGFIAIVNLIDILPNAKFYLMDFTFKGRCFHDMNFEKMVCETILKDKIVVV
jgi:hypothetical protein